MGLSLDKLLDVLKGAEHHILLITNAQSDNKPAKTHRVTVTLSNGTSFKTAKWKLVVEILNMQSKLMSERKKLSDKELVTLVRGIADLIKEL